jgi:hypothetical protein
VAVETFIPKKLTKAHEWVVRQANKIIEELREKGYSPLTLRQIHYQFVSRDLYENTQANYKRLGNILDAARKAGLVDWDAIADRTRYLDRIAVWTSPEDGVKGLHEQFKLDPWEEQPTLRHIEVWVEKDAAIGIVEPTCNALRIPFFSCRGYTSSSGLYEAGKRLASYQEAGYETLVLYLGDHDPSGVQMTDVSNDRVQMYSRRDIEFRRIALTLDQVAEFNPPPNFVKETDSRTKWYTDKFETEDCWELDALDPEVVDKVIRAHVEPLIDAEAWTKTLETEEEHRATLAEIISDWKRTKAAPAMLEQLRRNAGLPHGGEIKEDDIRGQQWSEMILDARGLIRKHRLG